MAQALLNGCLKIYGFFLGHPLQDTAVTFLASWSPFSLFHTEVLELQFEDELFLSARLRSPAQAWLCE